ncbi:hypothetical protein K2173_008805 [Erythroxylum novogranatense]|uniref:Folylpolyglutamate synthase n=1 Tax=Erythroxylum novogranatense TaxID=1862640 RepID=A0AAV8SM34_9ROSI|nr:hypothetical protein K2173_008805 [Erythroxylum novogranatense]
MEILGNTLGEIAGEKAGIFKHAVPAFAVPQLDEAMHVLEDKASKLEVPLKVAPPLDVNLLNGLKLGLEGEHQFVNAGLAVALSSTWLQKTGHLEVNYLEQNSSLPEQFIKGLTTSSLQGRAQIVPDHYINNRSDGDLVFYLDGAHSPESMDICAKWFSVAIADDNQQNQMNHLVQNNSGSPADLQQRNQIGGSTQKMQVYKRLQLTLELVKKEMEISKIQFRERIEPRKEKIPAQVSQVIEEELAKLQLLEASSSEFNVTQNYLDWSIALPWEDYSVPHFLEFPIIGLVLH